MKKIIVFLLSLTIALTPALLITNAYASGEETVDMLRKKIQLMASDIQDTRKKVVGYKRSIRDIVNEAGAASTVVKNHVAETVPTKTKVGKPMLERAKAYKGGIAGIVGGAAITGLIEAVGWVMDEGTWVKYKDKDNTRNPQYQYECFGSKEVVDTVTQCGEILVQNQYGGGKGAIGVQNCKYTNNAFCTFVFPSPQNPSNYQVANRIPRKTPEQPKPKIAITDQDVGGIILGDYIDPVNQKYNDTSKQWKPDAVIAAYTEDPNGIGNDASDEMERKLDNAPPTPDGKPAPPGDPRYKNQEPTEDNPNQNDRSWEDTGGKADGESNPITDPETGQPTGGQSISLQFPVFCEWAHSMCKWYDDWKASDKVYKDHLKKTEEHQADEKTFWQTIKDWIGWTQQEPEQDTDTEVDVEQPEEFDTSIFTKDRFQVSRQCPAPEQHTITLSGVSVSFSFDMTPLCTVLEMARPALVACSYLYAAYIVIGAARNG